MFFKWFFKAAVAIYLVTHTFDIVMAVFDIGQNVVSGAAGVIHGNTSIDIDATIAQMRTGMENMGVGEPVSYTHLVNRNGMACCPFHNDKTPSMKLDQRYHCFGCGADGDVIDFAAALYGLGKKEAAIQLAQDFGLSYEDWKPPVSYTHLFSSSSRLRI